MSQGAQLGAAGHSECGEDVDELVAHCVLRQEQALPDLTVRASRGDEHRYLALALRERVERTWPRCFTGNAVGDLVEPSEECHEASAGGQRLGPLDRHRADVWVVAGGGERGEVAPGLDGHDEARCLLATLGGRLEATTRLASVPGLLSPQAAGPVGPGAYEPAAASLDELDELTTNGGDHRNVAEFERHPRPEDQSIGPAGLEQIRVDGVCLVERGQRPISVTLPMTQAGLDEEHAHRERGDTEAAHRAHASDALGDPLE